MSRGFRWQISEVRLPISRRHRHRTKADAPLHDGSSSVPLSPTHPMRPQWQLVAKRRCRAMQGSGLLEDAPTLSRRGGRKGEVAQSSQNGWARTEEGLCSVGVVSRDQG